MNDTQKRTFEFDEIDRMNVPMSADQELAVADRAGELARRLGFGSDQIDEIRIAVIEAVINAIEHGHSSEGRVQVTFGATRAPLRLAIMVGDRGSGFNPQAVSDPDITKKIGFKTRKRGWG
ncbi:MAG TPA: ATP-binding protein, partial [Candidatus Glassbacteria bacterium]|nr:ATP-binding protein [Candidatus Glassbacteria bacterium]